MMMMMMILMIETHFRYEVSLTGRPPPALTPIEVSHPESSSNFQFYHPTGDDDAL